MLGSTVHDSVILFLIHILASFYSEGTCSRLFSNNIQDSYVYFPFLPNIFILYSITIFLLYFTVIILLVSDMEKILIVMCDRQVGEMINTQICD